MHNPQYCPNQACKNHHSTGRPRRWFVLYGHYPTAVGGSIQRYRCKSCGLNFSSQTFSRDRGVHRRVSYRKLESLREASCELHEMGRILGASAYCVSDRLRRLETQHTRA